MRGQFTAIATVVLLSGSLVWKAEAPTMIGAGSLVATTAGEGPITATVIMAGEGPITDTAAGTGLTTVVGGTSLNATCKETPAGRCFAPGFKRRIDALA